MKKQIDEKKLARRSFLRLITGFSAATSGIFLGLISPANAWNGQQEGTDSSDRAASDSDSDSSDQSGRSGSDSDSSDQSEGSDSSDRAASDSDSSDQSEGSDASDRSASDSDADSSDSSGR